MRSVIITLLLVVIACGHARPIPDAPDEACPGVGMLAALVRTACYGPRSIYWVAVCRDGTVVYEGTQHVAQLGRRVGHLNAPARARLVELLVKAPAGPSPISEPLNGDAPAVHCASWTDGVVHWLAPGPIDEAFEQVVGVARWVGRR